LKPLTTYEYTENEKKEVEEINEGRNNMSKKNR
jgi:hypothetical protein